VQKPPVQGPLVWRGALLRFDAVARRALELDPQNSEAHISLATADMRFFRNIAGDEVEIRKGLALDSGSPYARHVFCWFHDEMGRAQEAVAQCRKSVELDPLSPCSGTPITASARTTEPSCSRTKHWKSTPGTVRLLQVLGTDTGRWGATKRQSSNTSKPCS
jgi:hypothetical protein